MKPHSAFTVSDAIETFLLSAFLGILIFLPSMVEAGLDVAGQQVRRVEKMSDEFSVYVSAHMNQLVR